MAGPFAETTVPLEFQGQPWGQTTLVGRAAPGRPGRRPGAERRALGRRPRPGRAGREPGAAAAARQRRAAARQHLHRDRPARQAGAYRRRLRQLGHRTPPTAGSPRASCPACARRAAADSAQLLYRFTSAATQRAAARRRGRGDAGRCPPGTVIDWGSWLTAQQSEGSNAAIMEPFVVAFALIGLVMAVLIVGNVISGAVIAQYQRIGVLKSLGLTPAQVVAVYLSRVGWPALAGCLAGVVGGYLLAVPGAAPVGRRLRRRQPAGAAVGAGRSRRPGCSPSPLLAALGPALRAGRLSAVEAIAAGRAPAHRPRVRRAPAGRPAAPAAPGRPGPGRAVRPARPHPGDAGRDRVRRHRGDLRVRAALLAEPAPRPPRPWRPRCRSRSSRTARGRPDQVPTAAQFAAATAALSAAAGHRARERRVREPGQGGRRRAGRQRAARSAGDAPGWGTR